MVCLKTVRHRSFIRRQTGTRRYDLKVILIGLLRAAALTGPRPERVIVRLSLGANQVPC